MSLEQMDISITFDAVVARIVDSCLKLLVGRRTQVSYLHLIKRVI